MYKLKLFLIFLIINLGTPLDTPAQIIDDYLADEKYLYAATKQVSQFFRRFNGVEDERGIPLPQDNKSYQSPELRKNYLGMLFDNETSDYGNDLKRSFVKDVINQSDPSFLDFHGDGWFAEVNASFSFKGKNYQAIMFLRLEQENLGYKWVFDNVYFEPFVNLFNTDSARNQEFLHPMSHEIDFMNLKKVFDNKEKVEDYTKRQYDPDYLSLFLYEIKNSNLQFKTIKNVKFHFFQVNNWYFEISEFNRSGYNKGWLISNLVEVPEEQKDLLLNYIYLRK